MSLPFVRTAPIRLRLSIAYVLFLVATIVIADIFVLGTLETYLQSEVDGALRLRAAQVQREVDLGPDGRLDQADAVEALSNVAPQEEFSAPGIYVQVQDDTQVVLASSPNLPTGRFPATREIVAAALDGQDNYANVPVGPDRVRVLARPITDYGRVVGVLLVGESLHLLDTAFRQITYLQIVAAAIATAVSLASAWWLTGRALGPVAAVSRVARRIATTGQFEQRIRTPPAQDELGDLIATFNDMLDRLASTFRRQREFLADVSHELRGPLAVMRGNLDLLKMDLPEADRQESVQTTMREVERVSALVTDLLFLAEVDTEETVRREPVDLDHVVMTVFERAHSVDAGSHDLRLLRHDRVAVTGDRERLEQLAWNLVTNALRYTPTGGSVTLSLQKHDRGADLVVTDTGIGIPLEHQPHIFERFYRVDRARSRDRGSTGLGLAIVKQVADAHRGQVHVRSEPGKGSTFTVVLPMSQS